MPNGSDKNWGFDRAQPSKAFAPLVRVDVGEIVVLNEAGLTFVRCSRK